MKLATIAAALSLLAHAQAEQTSQQSELVADRKVFEDFTSMYSNNATPYTEAEKDLQQRLVKLFMNLFEMEHIDTYTPAISHPKTNDARGNNNPEVTRHGKVVELNLDGRGWDTSYQIMFQEDAFDDGSKWNLGVTFEANTEFDLSWKLPIYMNIQESVSLFEFAPLFKMSLNAWATMEIHLWFVNFTLGTWIQPYTFTPFDTSIRVDPIRPQRYCHGIDYYGEALVFKIDYEQAVNECHVGLFGWLFPLQVHGDQIENLDCQWRHYRPETPIYKTQITKAGDFFGPYYNYRCMAWHRAEWENWPLSQETIMQARQERFQSLPSN